MGNSVSSPKATLCCLVNDAWDYPPQLVLCLGASSLSLEVLAVELDGWSISTTYTWMLDAISLFPISWFTGARVLLRELLLPPSTGCCPIKDLSTMRFVCWRFASIADGRVFFQSKYENKWQTKNDVHQRFQDHLPDVCACGGEPMTFFMGSPPRDGAPSQNVIGIATGEQSFRCHASLVGILDVSRTSLG